MTNAPANAPIPAEYAVLLLGDENKWESASPDEQARVFALHDEFSRLLAERGHEILGGAQLPHSSATEVVRGARGATVVTDGPYAETAEQLGGFYLVRTGDLDDLLDLCGILAADGEPIEVRQMLGEDEGE